MIVNYAKNPMFSNADSTAIDLTVRFSHFDFEVPFTASANDGEAHGRDIFARALAGEFGEVAPFVAPVVGPAVAIAEQRTEVLAARVADLEAQAVDLRAQLAKLV